MGEENRWIHAKEGIYRSKAVAIIKPEHLFFSFSKFNFHMGVYNFVLKIAWFYLRVCLCSDIIPVVQIPFLCANFAFFHVKTSGDSWNSCCRLLALLGDKSRRTGTPQIIKIISQSIDTETKVGKSHDTFRVQYTVVDISSILTVVWPSFTLVGHNLSTPR